MLRRVGLTTLGKTPDYYGYALTMGDAEVRLDELVAAYAAIARGGSWRRPTLRSPARSSVRRARHVPARRLLAGGRPLRRRRARLHLRRRGSLDFPFPVAVKTGTSQAYHDNWTIGFTRDVTVGVWVGNFDRTPLQNSSGVTGAAPIFHDVMLAAQARLGRPAPAADDPLVDRPSDLAPRVICALSGREATEYCPRLETEWIPDDRPAASCRWHRRQSDRVVVDWPPAYRAWARQQEVARVGGAGGVSRARGFPRERGPSARARAPSGCASSTRRRARPTSSIRPCARSSRPCPCARSRIPAPARLEWEVDGRAVGASPADRALDWPLARGEHTVAVSDGRSQRRNGDPREVGSIDSVSKKRLGPGRSVFLRMPA